MDLNSVGEPLVFRFVIQNAMSQCRCESPEICTYDPRFVYELKSDTFVLNKKESERYNETHSGISILEPTQELYTVSLKDKSLTLPETEAMRYCHSE